MDEVELLLRLVSTPSPTGRTDAMRDLLLELAPGLGLDATVDAAGSVRMSIGEGGRHVLFLCHMDTVPGDVPVRIEGGVLHGRGSVDAKGCLATAMAATAYVTGVIEGRVTIVAVPDEEGASQGVRELVRGPAPDFVIVGEPSGWGGITIGYKGDLRLLYSGSTGKVHAGAGEPNSAERAVGFWNGLMALCEEENASKTAKRDFERLTARLPSFNTNDDGLELRTEMTLDVRIPPGADTDRLLSYVEAARGDAQVDVLSMEPPVLAPKNNELVRALIAAIRAQGGEPTFKRKTGTSDMNVAAQAWPSTPIVAYGPGDSRRDHTPEERQDLAEYRRAIEVTRVVLQRLIGPPKSKRG